jgi:hypothetical protein
MIAEVIIADSDVLIAISHISMALAKEPEPNLQTFLVALKSLLVLA